MINSLNSPLVYNFLWDEIHMIRRNQSIICIFKHSLEGIGTALVVDVPVNALFHIVFLEQIQNLAALIALIQGRIVQEHQLPPISRSL
jgi:hypothetical protein